MTYAGPDKVSYIPSTAGYPSAIIPAGTVVLTLRGALPVEHLHPGDRLVTRSGASMIERVYAHSPGCFTLEHGSQDPVYVLDKRVCDAYEGGGD
ncbi:MAG: hypothetical protein ACP5DX_13720 [Paracoccaceae bacterium]